MITREEFEDALAELVNIGVGRAAASLASMVKDRIELSVPRLVTIPYSELPQHLGLVTELEQQARVSIVQQPFAGGVGGTASILFPIESARKLVSLLTDGALSAEELDLEMEAALTEVGNILINSVLGTLGNVTGVEIVFHLPEYTQCSSKDLETSFGDRDLLLAVVLIGISGQEIKGHMVLLFDMPSMESLQEAITRMSEH
jgi:chemotaxis protein CheC